jgi:acetyl-CoA carboxylase biotin carboxyl carrier protein
LDIKEIKELIRALQASEIAEFTLETESVKLSIRKQTAFSAPSVMGSVSPGVTAPPGAVVEERPAEAAPTPVEDASDDTVTIVAPMVGVFYRAPAPDAPPYVQVGDEVEVGQPLCIIEAMKLMNEIESELKGKVLQILVENAQPVEYGQPLFVIQRT